MTSLAAAIAQIPPSQLIDDIHKVRDVADAMFKGAAEAVKKILPPGGINLTCAPKLGLNVFSQNLRTQFRIIKF